MGQFVGHESCPKCNSRDNLARYDDGSAWCFGCGYYEHSTSKQRKRPTRHPGALVAPFNDWEATLPARFDDWLSERGLNASEKALFKYSPHYDRLIFPVYNKQGDVIYYEARSVDGRMPKTLSHGIKPIVVFYPPFSDKVGGGFVIAEDVISALRISHNAKATPLFGSAIPRDFWPFYKTFGKRLVVWLDADKYREAIKQARIAETWGFSTKVVRTDKDPKWYSDKEIKEILS